MLTLTSVPPSHPVNAVSVVCRVQSKFLLIKRAKATFKHWLAFPGGSVEAGETPIEAAKRELLEETNLTAHQLTHLVTLNFGDQDKQAPDYFLSVYHADHFEGNVIAGDDALEAVWMDIHQMQFEKVIPSVYQVAFQLMNQENQLS